MSSYKSIHTKLCGKTIEQNNNLVKDLLETGLDIDKGIWLFGYGSLMWKTNFKYERKCVCYIKGYLRRFWQSSVDHRGTIEKPGRVATLIPVEDKEITYGVAYYVPSNAAKETLEALTHREKHGFTLSIVDIYNKDNSLVSRKAFLYIATAENEGFVKNETLEEIAEKIAIREGPSGSNRDYLFNIAETLIENDVITDDDKKHTMKLYYLVKDIIWKNTEYISN